MVARGGRRGCPDRPNPLWRGRPHARGHRARDPEEDGEELTAGTQGAACLDGRASAGRTASLHAPRCELGGLSDDELDHPLRAAREKAEGRHQSLDALRAGREREAIGPRKAAERGAGGGGGGEAAAAADADREGEAEEGADCADADALLTERKSPSCVAFARRGGCRESLSEALARCRYSCGLCGAEAGGEGGLDGPAGGAELGLLGGGPGQWSATLCGGAALALAALLYCCGAPCRPRKPKREDKCAV